MMNQIYEKLVKCADAVKSKIKFQPKVALILGSGLGDYAETMQVEETMEYTEIEGFPVSTVAGHRLGGAGWMCRWGIDYRRWRRFCGNRVAALMALATARP